jgi:hypothetical protein
MRTKVKPSVFLRLLLFCLTSAAVTGCGPSTAHVGTYIGEIKPTLYHHEITLELKETGVGVWRVGDEEVTFSWYVKGNELRLNTRHGGVIVGSLDNGVIHVILPGPQEIFFNKVK